LVHHLRLDPAQIIQRAQQGIKVLRLGLGLGRHAVTFWLA
jgi:hypothetical protein